VFTFNCLCGLVVRVSGYRSRGPGSILGATRFSEELWVWNGVHSASRVQLRNCLKEKERLRPTKSRYGVGNRRADHGTPSTRKDLALTSPTSGGRSVDIVRLRTQATDFFSVFTLGYSDGITYMIRIKLAIYSTQCASRMNVEGSYVIKIVMDSVFNTYCKVK
jgi:hypothetical protein